MIRKCIVYSILLFVIHAVNGQWVRIDTSNGITREIYYVDNQGHKQGSYQSFYKNKPQVSGEYIDDKKSNTWIFQPDKKFKMTGYYHSGIKDSIWTCYVNNKIYSTHNFRTGEKRSYFPNGKLKTKSDSIDHTYHFMEFSHNERIIRQTKSDSIYTESKEFDKYGNLIKHIILKNGFPYELIKINDSDDQMVYTGDISKGNGMLYIKIRSYNSGKLYLYEKTKLTNSKPNGIYQKFSENGDILISGQYNDGFMTGRWEKYDSKTFLLDTVLHYTLNDSIKNDTAHTIGIQSGERMILVEDMPTFKNKSLSEFRLFVSSHLTYPKEALKKGIDGKVYVQFTVNNIGKVENAVVFKGVHESLDNEALRIVQSSPYWRPGMQHGFPVNVRFTMPIIFYLK